MVWFITDSEQNFLIFSSFFVVSSNYSAECYQWSRMGYLSYNNVWLRFGSLVSHLGLGM